MARVTQRSDCWFVGEHDFLIFGFKGFNSFESMFCIFSGIRPRDLA